MLGTYCKHDLPNYDVFDEQRYFTPDNRPLVFDLNGTGFGVNICEDTWFSYAPECAKAAGAAVLLVLEWFAVSIWASSSSASTRCVRTSRVIGCRSCMPISWADRTSSSSMARPLCSTPTASSWPAAPQFEESLLLVDFVDGVPQPATVHDEPNEEALAYSALVLGVRDYLGKNGFPGAIIGLVGRRRFGADAGDRGRCAWVRTACAR